MDEERDIETGESPPGREAGRAGASRNGGGTDEDPGFLTPSNLLSLTRIPLGFVFLFSDDPRMLASVVAVGAFTDVADGFVARFSNTESQLGVLLDPFCDKFFVLMGLVSFLPGSELGWAGFAVLILRDVFTAGSYATGLIAGRLVPFRARLGGKATTALQVLTLFALIFAPRWVPLLLIGVAAASLYAIIDYGNEAIRGLQRRERGAVT